MISVFTIVPKVRGFQPGQGRWIFTGNKNPQHDFLRRGNKTIGPMLEDFMACRTLKV
jgi:hypothetical protein